jgi:hypothetical protein
MIEKIELTDYEVAVTHRLLILDQLYKRSRQTADSIAERSCASCEKALIEAQSRHAEEVNGLTDEVIGVRKDRDTLYEFIRDHVYGATCFPVHPAFEVIERLQREEEALKAVRDELAEDIDADAESAQSKVARNYKVNISWSVAKEEDINAEAANDETLRFTPEDRVVPNEAGAKAVEE